MTSEYKRWPDKGPSGRHFGRAVDRSIACVVAVIRHPVQHVFDYVDICFLVPWYHRLLCCLGSFDRGPDGEASSIVDNEHF